MYIYIYIYTYTYIASRQGCVTSLGSLLLTFHFATIKCYLAMGSPDHGKNKE